MNAFGIDWGGEVCKRLFSAYLEAMKWFELSHNMARNC
jgi:hypothetical protein